MIKNSIRKIMLAVFLLVGISNANAGECMQVGGTALANSVSETRLVAALSGSMTGASAEILKQTKTKTGLVLDMEHYFVNDKGGMIQTKDKAVLTNVVGKIGTYMLEIDYSVVKSHGTLEGYKGSFSSYGIIKLNEGKVILRYQGKLCK